MKKKFSINSNLANAISETLEMAESNVGSLAMETICLDDITLDPENPRKLKITLSDIKKGNTNFPESDPRHQEIEELRSLGETIKDHGLINPILVHRDKGNYKLIAGERRTLASRLAGLKNIPARVVQNKPEKDKISILQWIENIERSPLSLWDKIGNLKTILKETNLKPTKTNLANILCCSERTGARYASLLKINDDYILGLIKSGEINNIQKAISLSKLSQDDRESLDIESNIRKLSQKAIEKKVSKKPSKSKRGTPEKITISISSNYHAERIFNAIKADPVLMTAANLVNEPNWKNKEEVFEAMHELSELIKEIPANG